MPKPFSTQVRAFSFTSGGRLSKVRFDVKAAISWIRGMAASSVEAGICELQRQIALTDIVVGFEILDRGAVDDLSLVDDSGSTGEPEAEMHVLFGDQNGGAGAAQLPQQFADPLHDDWRQALTRFVQQ